MITQDMSYAPPSTRPLSYAPTSYGSLPHSTLNAQIPLDEEVKLTATSSERDLLDSLAEIYSIIRTLDGLERAYQKDALGEAEYNEMCSKMLKQYKSILSDANVSREFGELEDFMRTWNLEAPRALETLRTGLTHTEIYAASRAQPTANIPTASTVTPNQPSGALILTATENFITFLDALRLNMLSKSSLHPLLSDVIQSVNKVTNEDFENRGKIIQWLITLNQMKAGEELSEEQARECAFDLEGAYGGFKSIIN